MDLLARLDPCAAWFRQPTRTRNLALAAFPIILMAGFLSSVPWESVRRNFSAARPATADPAVAAEARRLALDYEAVAANPAAHVGKPVLWCVAQDGSRAFVDGRTGWLVEMGGLPTSGAGWRGDRCVDVVARVAETSSGPLRLEYLGRP